MEKGAFSAITLFPEEVTRRKVIQRMRSSAGLRARAAASPAEETTQE
jgi:hypothetical protein